MPILVTLFGISASPAHFEFPVTTLFVIVKVPLVLQSIGPSAAALIIVRPFHVVAVPKPSAAKLTFTTRSALVLLNALRPIVGASPAKASDSNAVALLNAQVAIEATLFGMVIEVSEVALLNAYSPIEVTLFGMVIAVSDLAPSNALLPIEVRELPAAKDTVWRALASANARLPIEVTVFGIAADPAQFVFPVTTLFVIVKVPVVPQSIGPSAAALIIVRPFHVVAVPNSLAEKPMFATASRPTEPNALVPTVFGASPSKVTDVSEVAR